MNKQHFCITLELNIHEIKESLSSCHYFLYRLYHVHKPNFELQYELNLEIRFMVP